MGPARWDKACGDRKRFPAEVEVKSIDRMDQLSSPSEENIRKFEAIYAQ
jgi:hypothetical protein